MKKKIVGIMVRTKANRQKFLQLYHPFVNDDVFLLIAFTPQSIRYKKKRVRGLYMSKGELKERFFPMPDAIYNQCYNKKPLKLQFYFPNMMIFNQINQLNKWDIYNILEQANLHHYLPTTMLFNEAHLLEMLKKHDTLYLKPCYGSHGENVFRIRKTQDNSYHIYTSITTPKYSLPDLNSFLEKVTELIGEKNFLIQEEVRFKPLKKDPFEVRMIVQKDEAGEWGITASICRITPNRSIITNNTYRKLLLDDVFTQLKYSTTKQLHFSKSFSEISLATATAIEKKLGLFGQLSVDLALTMDDHIKIIEINGMPSKEMVNELKNDQISRLFYSKPIGFLKFLASNK